MCRVLGLSPSGYYAWVRRPPSARAKRDAELVLKIRKAYDEYRQVYGRPRLYAELKEAGEVVGEKRVGRLMKQEGEPEASGAEDDPAERGCSPCSRSRRTELHGRRTRPALGRRHHVYPGFRRVPLPGRRARCVEPPSERLGHGDAPAHGARPRLSEHGRLAAPARASDPSLGPRHATQVQEVVATPQERGGVAMAASKRRRSDRALRPPMGSPGRPPFPLPRARDVVKTSVFTRPRKRDSSKPTAPQINTPMEGL